MTLLLVGDSSAEVERTFLESLGFEVTAVGSGEEALARMEEVCPTMIVLNLSLPDLGGEEVCRLRRGRWQDIPVLLTCKALEELMEEATKNPAPPNPLPPSDPRMEDLLEENRRLHRRILELEEENRDFAEQIVRTEEMNNTLTSLYVASSRLHSVLDREKVAQVIKEVVINFIGAEKFALLALDRKTGELRFEDGEGFEGEDFPPLPSGEGIWKEVIGGGERWFRDRFGAEGSDDPHHPLAAIPLRVHDRPMGAIAVYRLFIEKERFTAGDLQLFSMLAEHAATALFSSMLYHESERKRETYRGFMDLLLK